MPQSRRSCPRAIGWSAGVPAALVVDPSGSLTPTSCGEVGHVIAAARHCRRLHFQNRRETAAARLQQLRQARLA